MINIIHFFNDSIDLNSILNVSVVLGEIISRHIVIYTRPDDEKLILKGIEYHVVSSEMVCGGINHLLENMTEDTVLFLNGPISLLATDSHDFIKYFIKSNYDFSTPNTSTYSGFYGSAIENHNSGKLTFTASLKLAKQIPDYDSTILNPGIFLVNRLSLLSLGSFDKAMSYSTETLIGLSVNIVMAGHNIYYFDGIVSENDSSSYSYNRKNKEYLTNQLGIGDTSKPLNVNENIIKRNRVTDSVISFEEYLNLNNRSIVQDRDFRRKFSGKTIAVLYPGISLDDLRPFNIYLYDYVIGIDFVGRIFKCDMVFTQELHVLSDLSTTYDKDKIIATDHIYDRMQNKYVTLRDITDRVNIIDTTSANYDLEGHSPYLIDSDPLVCLTHFLVSAKPRLIQILGADFKWLKGRSHVNNSYYNGGFVKPDEKITREADISTLKNIEAISRLADTFDVKVMRNYNV